MRVLLTCYFLGAGGSERQLSQTALELAKMGVDVQVGTVAGGFREQDLERAGIPVYRLPLRTFSGPSYVVAAWLLKRHVERARIDLVHTFDFTTTIFAVPVTRFFSPAKSVAGQRCFLEVVPRKYRLLLRPALRAADVVVVNSQSLKHHLSQRLGLDARKVRVCPNGVDTAVFRPGPRQRLREVEGARLVLGTVGVLRPEKNVALLLDAFARLKTEDASLGLVIAGDGPERESLVRHAASLGITSNCFFPSRPDVLPYLRSIDVFVHTSVSEGLPNALMEAMATGCCVVCSDIPACRELIAHEERGLLFRIADTEDLVRQIRRVLQDESLRERLSQAASEYILRNYSLEKAVRTILEVYVELLGH